MKEEEGLIIHNAAELIQPATRRKFLRALTVGGSVVFLPTVFAACSDDNDVISPPPPPPPPVTPPTPGPAGAVLNLNTDVGIFNYAFALEQLEAAFYIAVVNSSVFGTLSAVEREVFADLRNHEIIHREFFRRALGSSAIPDLALNAATLNTLLASRTSILAASEQFEDLGVAAYNGAGKQLKDVNNLLVAGKIVSVEARHAAIIRDLRDTTGRRFAGDDVVNAQGLDVKLEPAAVLARVTALNLVTTAITVATAPTDPATPDAPPPATV